MHGEFVPECEGTILFIGDPALDQGGIKMWELYEVSNEDCEADCGAGPAPLGLEK